LVTEMFAFLKSSQLTTQVKNQVTVQSSLHGWKRKPSEMPGRLRYRRLVYMYTRLYTYMFTFAMHVFQRRVGS
jgi:hypothetical protein